jgi:hypothetical protein
MTSIHQNHKISANQPGQPKHFGQSYEYFGQDKPNPRLAADADLGGMWQTKRV